MAGCAVRRGGKITNFLAFAWLPLLLMGCSQPSSTSVNSREGQASSGPEKEAALDAVPSADQVKSLENLVASGIRLVQNSRNGQYDSADCSQIVVTDSMADWLSRIGELTRLVIRQSSLSNQGWATVGKLSSVEHLDLRECPINDEQILLLLRSMKRLRSFRLYCPMAQCQLGSQALAQLQHQSQLQVLSLEGFQFALQDLSYLAQCSRLSELYLAQTTMDDRSLSYLSACVQLKKIRLAQTSVGADGLRLLQNLRLEELDVSQCESITDEALSVIGGFGELKRLNLWRDAVSDAGLIHLASLRKLQWLNLDNTQISDVGLVSLQPLSELQFLHLGSTKVSDNGLPALAKLSNLQKLIVTRTQVTASGTLALQHRLPAAEIQLEYLPQ